MRHALVMLVVLQFAVYATLTVLAFIGWAIVVSDRSSLLETVAGGYVSGHFVRWTARFPWWGVLMLLSAALSVAAACFLRRLRKAGGYLGVVSFSIGFGTNLVVAQNLLVHSLVGWALLSPLAVAWKDLLEPEK